MDIESMPTVLRRTDSISRATSSYLGASIIDKITEHQLDDEKLVLLISQSNLMLKEVLEKYALETPRYFDQELQDEIVSVIYAHNFDYDRNKLESLSEGLNKLMVEVGSQKNQLAAYRNELREVVQLTNETDSNKSRLADITGIINFLDLKVVKVENDIQSARSVVESLNKCFDFTFFHIKHSIKNKDNNYLDVMHRLSLKKTDLISSISGLKSIILLSILMVIYNVFASSFSWEVELYKKIEGGDINNTLSYILYTLSIIFLLVGCFLTKKTMQLKDTVSPDESMYLLISTVSAFLLSFFLTLFGWYTFVDGGSSNIIGYSQYQLANLGLTGTFIYVGAGLGALTMALKKKKGVSYLSHTQDEIYRLCKGK